MTTIKSYNKWRHQHLLGKDVNGKKLYPGDYIRILIDFESSVPYCSKIYWDCLHGASIERHPAHKAIDGHDISYCDVRDLAGILRYQEVKSEYVNASVEKISYKEYLEWYDKTKVRYVEYAQTNKK